MKNSVFSIISAMSLLLPTSVLAADIFIPEVPVYTPPAASLYIGFGAGYDALMAPRTNAIEQGAPKVVSKRFPGMRDGWFGNAFIGWKANDDNSSISQAEIYSKLTGQNTHLNLKGNRKYALEFMTPSGNDGSAAITAKPELHQEHNMLELGARLKNGRAHDLLDIGGSSFGVEPFLAHYTQTTSSYIVQTGASGSRTGDINAWIGGVNFSAETSIPLGHTLHALLRASAGVYGVTADGQYDYAALGGGGTTSNRYSDNNSTIGGRFGGEARLVHVLSRNVTIAAVAGIDYWTSLPTARMSRTAIQGPMIGTGLHDYMHVNAGLEMTFAFGG